MTLCLRLTLLDLGLRAKKVYILLPHCTDGETKVKRGNGKQF